MLTTEGLPDRPARDSEDIFSDAGVFDAVNKYMGEKTKGFCDASAIVSAGNAHYMPRIRAQLIVSGTKLDPDMVTAKLGIQPDVRQRRGYPNVGPDVGEEVTMPDDVRPRIQVALLVRSDGVPETITELIGLAPDEVSSKGAILPRKSADPAGTPKIRACTSWRLNSQVQEFTYDVEEHIKTIIERVTPVKAKIASLNRQEFNVTLDICLDLADGASPPALGLSPETMRFFADLNIPVEVDLYAWDSLPDIRK